MSSLSRPGIVECAIELGDERGLAAVTLRGVAQRLGVTPMALYRHVHDKDELLDELADALYAQLDLGPAGQDWWGTLRRLAHSARTLLLSHPWALPLFARPLAGPHARGAAETVRQALRDGGFTGRDVDELHDQLTNMVFALVAAELQGRSSRAGFERGLELLHAGLGARRRPVRAGGRRLSRRPPGGTGR